MPRRLHIALDIDGVLADFTGGFLPHLSAALGREILEDHITEYSFETSLAIPPHIWTPLWATHQHRVYADAEPYAGVIEGFEALRALGDLTIQTARPSAAADETLAWVERHLGGAVEVHFRADTGKYRLADAVDYFIEDSLHEVLRAEAGRPVVVDRPWNRVGAPEGVIRVRTLIEAAERIEAEQRSVR